MGGGVDVPGPQRQVRLWREILRSGRSGPAQRRTAASPERPHSPSLEAAIADLRRARRELVRAGFGAVDKISPNDRFKAAMKALSFLWANEPRLTTDGT